MKAAKAELTTLNAQTDTLAQQFPASGKVQTAATVEALQGHDWARGRTYGDKAVDLAQQSQNPQDMLAALKARGTAAWFEGDFPQAAQDGQRALKIDPKDKAAMALWQFSKGRLRASGPGLGAMPTDAARDKQLDEFLTQLSALDDPRVKAAGARASDRVEALRQLAEARRFSGLGDFHAAEQAADSAVAADPGLPDGYMERAVIFAALKEITKALAEVTKAISLWSASGDGRALAPAHALRSGLENETKDFADAYADADKAVSYDGRFGAAYRARAKAREGLGQKADAILADYKKAADLDPQQAPYYEDAVARLSGSAPPPARASSERGGWLNLIVLGALASLAAFVGLVAWLFKRSRRKARSSAAGMRRALDGQYDLGEQIGEGGMGAVYKGWDKTLKRPVAVKRLNAELQKRPRERDRFIKEAEMVASLRHPHIVEIYNIVRAEEDTYLVFEYIVGGTVHQLLNESPGRHLAPPRALEILRAVAEAVDHAHGRRVIHRDLKPANVMIADGGWVKVMDFGIARQVQDSLLTTTNTIVGTPTYMAPEQAMGAVVRESDVYALGVTLFEMLTGGLPFKGPDEMHDKLSGRFIAPSLLVPDLPSAVDAVVAKALAARAEDRYHSCRDFSRAAADALDRRITPLRS